MNVGAIMVDVPDFYAFDVISEKIHLLYIIKCTIWLIGYHNPLLIVPLYL